MREEFYELIGYETLYFISENGRIIKKQKCKINASGKKIIIPEHEVFPTTIINGFPCIALVNEKDKQNIKYVHRLLYQQFKAKRFLQRNEHVIHLDGDKTNFNLKNLKLK